MTVERVDLNGQVSDDSVPRVEVQDQDARDSPVNPTPERDGGKIQVLHWADSDDAWVKTVIENGGSEAEQGRVRRYYRLSREDRQSFSQ